MSIPSCKTNIVHKTQKVMKHPVYREKKKEKIESTYGLMDAYVEAGARKLSRF
jgi:hypothetical protein